MPTPQEQMKQVYRILKEKHGHDIVVIDITKVSALADYLLIVSAGSTPHMEALVDNVQEGMHSLGCDCKSLEGAKGGRWVLLDYGDIVVNIFSKEARLWYDLERIWRDGELVETCDTL